MAEMEIVEHYELIISNAIYTSSHNAPPLAFGNITDSAKKDTLGTIKEPVAARFLISKLDATQENNDIYQIRRFILTVVQRTSREKVQALQAFDSKFFLTSMGEEIPVYTISGILLDMSGEHDWSTQFDNEYNTKLKASCLIKDGNIAILIFGNRWIRCYPINYTRVHSADTESYCRFDMDLLVREDLTWNLRAVKTTIQQGNYDQPKTFA